MMNEPSCLIDGFGPLPMRRPGNVAELGEFVREAASANQAIYPVGGGTMLELGCTPTRAGFAVDLTGLDQVVDYPARDMTITVEAGIRIAHLQSVLAPENQRLPIDVPRADRATLGGILACNTSGPRRLGYGTLRDYVLGIRAVNDLGEEIKAGGRVVKNVAGYDLCKLLVGSLGTLAIITQATLKLRPLAEEQALFALSCEADRLAELLELLHASRTRPVCLDVLNRRAAHVIKKKTGIELRESAWTFLAGYEGNADAVRWQIQQLIVELGGRFPLEIWLGRVSAPVWQALVDFPALCEGEGMTFKANFRPSGTPDFCLHADNLEGIVLQAHAGNGIVVGRLTEVLSLGKAKTALQDLRARALAFNGAVVVERCPADWKDPLSVWGDARPDGWLIKKIKAQLDPRGLFNPGRFVEGI